MPNDDKLFLDKQGVKILAEEIFKKVNDLIDQRIIKTNTSEESNIATELDEESTKENTNKKE